MADSDAFYPTIGTAVKAYRADGRDREAAQGQRSTPRGGLNTSHPVRPCRPATPREPRWRTAARCIDHVLVARHAHRQPEDPAMPELDKDRIGDFVKQFRVDPGTKVKLPRDYDPDSTSGFKEEDAEGVLAQGIELLSEYQSRLAAQDTAGAAGDHPGDRRRRQGRHDPPRDERREPPGRAASAASRSPPPRRWTTTSCGATTRRSRGGG